MTDKEDVEISQYGAGKVAVEESLVYIRSNERITMKLKIAGLSMLVGAGLIMWFKQEPDVPSLDNGHPINTPTIDGANPSIDAGQYDRGDDARNTVSGGNRQKGPRMNVRLPGPKLISRSVKVRVPPGTEAQALLVTGGSNGLVKVSLKEDVIVAGESYLSAGTTLIGRGASTDDRLFVHFTKAVASDGTVSTIEADIADGSDKTIGLRGSFFSTHASRIAVGAGLNFLAGAAVALEDTQGQQGAVVAAPTARNAILNGTAKAALDESNDVASKYKNAPPAIVIKPGVEVVVIFDDNGG